MLVEYFVVTNESSGTLFSSNKVTPYENAERDTLRILDCYCQGICGPGINQLILVYNHHGLIVKLRVK